MFKIKAILFISLFYSTDGIGADQNMNDKSTTEFAAASETLMTLTIVAQVPSVAEEVEELCISCCSKKAEIVIPATKVASRNGEIVC